MLKKWIQVVAPLALVAAHLLATKAAVAAEYQIYVAPRDTPAAETATAKADGTANFAEFSLQKALDKAGQLLAAKGNHTATILMAGGNYAGKAGAGNVIVPQIVNPEASLRIFGGYAGDFQTRQPFENLTGITTNMGRNQAILQLSKQSKLRELVISGLLFDAAPSNQYDAETNSILKGSSRTVPLINFGILQTDHLVVADNIFLNGSHGAFDPYIAPASANTDVDIVNNFFVNTIKTLQIGAGIGFRNNTVRQVNLRHNTFLLNWPYNPDTTSSNVSAVTLYHNHGAKQLNIEDNIFAFNPGGAMQHDWVEARMPKISLRNNLFFQNAGLFGEGNADSGVMVGKFGTNAKYLILGLNTIQDDFGYNVGGNVAFDPQIPIALLPLKSVNNNAIQRQNTVMNDVRRLFGQNQQGGTVAIKNYAPAMAFDVKTLPLPKEPQAKPYGVQMDKLWAP